MTTLPKEKLRVGFVGSGFIADFHLKSMIGVRNVEVTGVFSRSAANRARIVKRAAELGLGTCTSHDSLESLLRAGDVDAVWICSPNHTRLDVMRVLHTEVKAGRSAVFAIACEKPLARTVAEAREMLRLAEDAGLNHGYLENQVFSTPVIRGKEIVWRRAASTTGRPYLARAAEEHSGPHEPWFWQGEMQGGGVLSDMMCHSVEVARHLLTAPGAPRGSLTVKAVNGTVANLKSTRPHYADQLRKRFGAGVDYRNRPAEDFARATVELEDAEGNALMIEASTSWAYVGAGLRIQLELLGPEYAMEFNSLGHRSENLHVARCDRRRGRGPRREAECRAGADACLGGRSGRLRLHRREPAHGRMLSQGRDAIRDFSRRTGGGRNPDGPLSLGGTGRDGAVPRTGTGDLRSAGGETPWLRTG